MTMTTFERAEATLRTQLFDLQAEEELIAARLDAAWAAGDAHEERAAQEEADDNAQAQEAIHAALKARS